MNQFGDLTQAEFQSLYMGLNIEVNINDFQEIEQSRTTVATSLDWRTSGIVTAVKNQGSCAASWAFSSTGAVEGCWALKTGSLISQSEQQLIDCSTSYGNEGCTSGLMTNSFNYITRSGICSETLYPYKGSNGKCTSCNFDESVTGYIDVLCGSESDLQVKNNIGPVSVAFDGSLITFQFYSSGIYNDASCSSTTLTQGGLVVGYGTSTAEYWIVKNSWGTGWGQQGYFYMARNANNACGIASQASLPTC